PGLSGPAGNIRGSSRVARDVTVQRGPNRSPFKNGFCGGSRGKEAHFPRSNAARDSLSATLLEHTLARGLITTPLANSSLRPDRCSGSGAGNRQFGRSDTGSGLSSGGHQRVV